jgi:hypothetical protein
MNQRSVYIFLLLISIWGCKNGTSVEGREAANSNVLGDGTQVFAVDTFFDLQKYRNLFRHKNGLSSIPVWSDTVGETQQPAIVDSNTLKAIYQDLDNHYFPAEVGSGNQFYAYVDTFKDFNLVCMYTGQGDGGDLYDLLTFTKKGKRISKLIGVAYFQGEEDMWDYNQRATIVGEKVNICTTACRRTFDTAGIAQDMICDTLRSYYQFKNNGEIILVRKDTVLNPALDSIRTALPYN